MSEMPDLIDPVNFFHKKLIQMVENLKVLVVYKSNYCIHWNICIQVPHFFAVTYFVIIFPMVHLPFESQTIIIKEVKYF